MVEPRCKATPTRAKLLLGPLWQTLLRSLPCSHRGLVSVQSRAETWTVPKSRSWWDIYHGHPSAFNTYQLLIHKIFIYNIAIYYIILYYITIIYKIYNIIICIYNNLYIVIYRKGGIITKIIHKNKWAPGLGLGVWDRLRHRHGLSNVTVYTHGIVFSVMMHSHKRRWEPWLRRHDSALWVQWVRGPSFPAPWIWSVSGRHNH